MVVGFLDESNKEISSRTVRLWADGKPKRIINYSLADTVKVSGFYALNGESVLERIDDGTSASICCMLEAIRRANGERPIMMVLDNASNHHSKVVTAKAAELNIELMFLPPYSPQYNHIEQIWKTVKREISKNFILDKDELFWLIKDVFKREACKLSYAGAWIRKFLPRPIRKMIFSWRVS